MNQSADASPALLVIDVQQGLDNPRLGPRNNPDAEKRIADLLAAWRAAGRPVIHVQHMSVEPNSLLRPGLPGNTIKKEALPIAGEPLFQKNVNSAFIGTDLEKYLRSHGIENLVMVGLTTEHCISSSARMAANLGFNVTVVADATATFGRRGFDGTHYSAELVHGVELASLKGEFATVRNSSEVLAEVGDSLPVRAG
ncbi:MAG: cysteine hydrolase [Gemmatimonadetes bacterium]|nr:MAG: cysteine hydrolase [Gemmatimonadota bacterium]